jgi:hypothetical protein
MDDRRRELYVAAQVREMDRRIIEQGGVGGYALMQRSIPCAAAGR